MKVVIAFILSGLILAACLVYQLYHAIVEELQVLHTVTITDCKGTKVFKNVDALQVCRDTIRFRTSEGIYVTVFKYENSIRIERK